jgi:hypothetical protein
MNKSEPIENAPLYFIDQYVDGQFMSRSEPFYDKDTCIDFFERLTESNDSGIFYRISVSMSLIDYEMLQLQTHKLHIKFLEKEPTHEPLVSEEYNDSYIENRPKAFRYNRGFVLLNNRKSRNFLDLHNLSDFFSQIGTGDHFFISKKEINRNNLNFENLVKVKNLTEKVSNLLPNPL